MVGRPAASDLGALLGTGVRKRTMHQIRPIGADISAHLEGRFQSARGSRRALGFGEARGKRPTDAARLLLPGF